MDDEDHKLSECDSRDLKKRTEARFESLLEGTGGFADIQNAMKSKNHAETVKAATLALEKALCLSPVNRYTDKKSADISNEFRRCGNLHFIDKDYKSAIQDYNRALAYAPIGSIELKLAYSNISAVMLSIKAYQACQLNIAEVNTLNCPENIQKKLDLRKKETYKHINDEMMRDMRIRCDQESSKYLEFDVKKHDQIPCASQDVTVGDAKEIVAANNIRSGTMVAMEKAYISVADGHNNYTTCYYCHRISLFLIPCNGCCKALFCSRECQVKCMEEYHKIECDIIGYPLSYVAPLRIYENSVTRMAIRAAIKMSLKMSWEQLSAASLDIGHKRLQSSSVKEALDPDSPVSLLCYNDQVRVDKEKMIKHSLVFAYAIHNLGQLPGYLPEGKTQREEAIDALSRIMLHLSSTFLRKINIYCSAYDFSKETYRCGVQSNHGWFSFASKLRHSCDPNLLVTGFNDQIALIAIKPIRKGDELTISFIGHFYDYIVLKTSPSSLENSLRRQKFIYDLIQYDCECPACINKWSGIPRKEAKLTKNQKKAYEASKTAFATSGFKKGIKIFGEALDELGDCVNTVQHFEVFRLLRQLLNVMQCAKRLNKTYDGQSRALECTC